MDIPNLAGVIKKEDLSQVNAGSYKADYVNWARTMNLMHEHAAGWHPILEPTKDGTLVHRLPIGGVLMIAFRHEASDMVLGPYPQAIMDNRNNPVPFEKITARDVTDTHRRGVCMAAAFAFGLAYELWAKDPVESGYHQPQQQAAPAPVQKANDMAGRFNAAKKTLTKSMSDEEFDKILSELKSEHTTDGQIDYTAVLAAIEKRAEGAAS